MDRLFAPWRLGHPAGVGSDGRECLDLRPEPGKTIFQTLEQSNYTDAETYILHRSRLSFAILNIYPYTTGHVMVLPKRPVVAIDELNKDEYEDVWNVVKDAAVAVKAAFNPDGLNVGVNEGQAGGGSIPDHLHVHVVPRWASDTNFMTAIANTRLLPTSLSHSWQKILDSWPYDRAHIG